MTLMKAQNSNIFCFDDIQYLHSKTIIHDLTNGQKADF